MTILMFFSPKAALFLLVYFVHLGFLGYSKSLQSISFIVIFIWIFKIVCVSYLFSDNGIWLLFPKGKSLTYFLCLLH